MIRVTPRTTLTALGILSVLAFGIAMMGCGSGRPPGIADRPGDSFVELSDMSVDQKGAEVSMKVHYRFPDGLPHPDAWFTFYFEVNGGKSGTIPVQKRGRDLFEEGDIDAVTSAVFLKRLSISFGVKVQQAPKKNGPWHDVSEKLICES